MSNKETIELSSKGAWSAMRKVKNGDIQHLKVTRGEDTTLLDSPMNFNLHFIPRVFTAPLQAIRDPGGVGGEVQLSASSNAIRQSSNEQQQNNVERHQCNLCE